MPYTHHSHSGQFCNHASDTLEEVVQKAVASGMTTMVLTEHVARDKQDLYPGEEIHPHYLYGLEKLFDDYYHEAIRLQSKYKNEIAILIGFEGEWIRPESLDIIQSVIARHKIDLFIGSVHHVHTIPIDFDDATYQQAREVSGGTDEKLFADYFDSQYDMLQKLQPPIVGHLDLIRLKSDDPDRPWTSMPSVWAKIRRNLEYIAEYGGVLEINTSALRKGLQQPYPRAEICEVSCISWDDPDGTRMLTLGFRCSWR